MAIGGQSAFYFSCVSALRKEPRNVPQRAAPGSVHESWQDIKRIILLEEGAPASLEWWCFWICWTWQAEKGGCSCAAKALRDGWYFLGTGVTSGLFSASLSVSCTWRPPKPSGASSKAAERWLIMTGGRWLPLCFVPLTSLQRITLDNYSDWVQMMQGGLYFFFLRPLQSWAREET